MLFVVRVIVRLVWSLTIGLVFFLIGTVLFLLLDIFVPTSDVGYRVLNSLFKVGSLGAFKGFSVKFEQDQFEVKVEKKRRDAA